MMGMLFWNWRYKILSLRMNIKLYQSKRSGALGALMDLYEQEAELLFGMINQKVKDEDWAVIKDAETKDEDCRSIQTICQHMVGAGKYYIELVKKGENPDYTIEKTSIQVADKADFEAQFKAVLSSQAAYYKGRWDMSNEAIDQIKIKTGWGVVLDPESLLEHAVLHVMRHHRQILRWLD